MEHDKLYFCDRLTNNDKFYVSSIFLAAQAVSKIDKKVKELKPAKETKPKKEAKPKAPKNQTIKTNQNGKDKNRSIENKKKIK